MWLSHRKENNNEYRKQGKAVFVSFCIEQYAKAKNMSTEDVVNLFEQYGIAEHFRNHTVMSAKITQDNLYMLLPLKIGWLAPWLSEDKGISLTDAINRIYHSQLYKKLSTESTKYWHLGPVDLYNELKEL